MLRIRIPVHLAVLDPDPYQENGFGSRIMEIDQNLQITQVFSFSKRLLFLRRYVFDLLSTVLFTVYFSVKNSTSVTLKSDQGTEPDPH